MQNYLKTFFEQFSCQSAIGQTIWTTRFENVAQAFLHFDFRSQERKENLRRALHVSLLYSYVLCGSIFYQKEFLQTPQDATFRLNEVTLAGHINLDTFHNRIQIKRWF